MKKALVTGGAGFIGYHLANKLLWDGYYVLVYDALTYAGSKWSPPDAYRDRFEFWVSDVSDKHSVDNCFKYFKPDIVFHLAAESHVDRSIIDSSRFIKTNVGGTLRILQAVKEYGCRLVHVSTDEVYGSMDGGELAHEGSPFRPGSPYAASKASGDLLVQSYFNTYKIDSVIVRPANTYGSRQHPEKLIPRMVVHCLDGMPLPMFGDGNQIRDWLHVTDLVDAILLVADRGTSGSVYNIPGNDWRTNKHVIECVVSSVCSITGIDPSNIVIRSVRDRPGHDVRYAMIGDRIHSMSWRPRMSFDDAIYSVVKWFVDNAKEWLYPKFYSNDDGVNKLYSSWEEL